MKNIRTIILFIFISRGDNYDEDKIYDEHIRSLFCGNIGR